MSVQQPGGSGSSVTITGSLPAGTNDIGSVDQHGAPWSVTVSGALPAGTNVLGHVITDSGSVTNAGVPALGQAAMASSLPVTIASNQSAVPASQSGSWTVTANAGTGFAGLPAALGQTTMSASMPVVIASNQSAIPVSQSGTWNVTVNAAIAAGTNTIGNVVPTGAATTGASEAHLASSANSNNATNVKASAGTVYGLHVMNTNAAVRYLKLYDKASAPAPASDTPVYVVPVPVSNGAIVLSFPVGLKFVNGIGYAMVTGSADNDNTSVGAGDLVGFSMNYV